MAKYNLDEEGYQDILRRQLGKCAICEVAHREHPNRKWGRGRLCVDHDHRTGAVRGLLCMKCNAAIGMLGDSERSLLNALRYIRENCGVDGF